MKQIILITLLMVSGAANAVEQFELPVNAEDREFYTIDKNATKINLNSNPLKIDKNVLMSNHNKKSLEDFAIDFTGKALSRVSQVMRKNDGSTLIRISIGEKECNLEISENQGNYQVDEFICNSISKITP